jgi:hypothetical protein
LRRNARIPKVIAYRTADEAARRLGKKAGEIVNVL